MGMATGYGMIVLAASAAERWAAARHVQDWYYGPLINWTVWVPAVVGIMLTLAAISVYRTRVAHKAMLKAFGKAADRFELTPDERVVLEHIAKLAKLKHFRNIFAMEVAFERGVSLLGQSRPVQEMPEEAVRRMTEVIESLRTKLGLEFTPYSDDDEQEVGLTQGDSVTFVHHGNASTVEATVTTIQEHNVTLQFADEVPLRVGQACVIHRVRDGQQWEYNVSVTEPGEGFVVVRLIGKPRKRNLRRFVRVPTRQNAYAAAFPFISLNASDEAPQFVSGTLTEIGGPGLRLDVPLAAEAGDRVLVVLEMGEGKTIQGIGMVRRVLASHDEVQTIAVEMVGLGEAEISEMQKETNAAARHNGANGVEQVLTASGTD